MLMPRSFSLRHLIDHPWFWRLAVIGGGLLSCGVLVWRAGIRIQGDSSWYINWADRILGGDFHGFWTQPVVPAPFYTGYTLFLAGMKVVFGQAFAAATVVVQVLAAALVPWLLFETALLIRPTLRPWLAAVGAFFCGALCFDALQWTAYILSDSLFLSLSVLLWYFLVRWWHGRRFWPAVLLATVLFFWRPSGVVFAPLLLLLWAGRRWFWPEGMSGAALARLGLVVLTLTVVLVGGYSWLMSHPPQGNYPLRSTFEWLRAKNLRGYVAGRRAADFSPPRTTLDFAVRVADNYYHMFRFNYPGYSRAHWWSNWFYFSLYYLLALVGLAQLIRGSPRVRLLAAMGLAWVHAFSLFFGFIGVGFDWRFQLANMPVIWTLFLVGLAGLFDRPRPEGQAQTPAPA
jgi:hypothetical protein